MFAIRSARTSISTALRARSLATPVTTLPNTAAGELPNGSSFNGRAVQLHQGAVDGARRPHLNIPVNPNHGLYAFFRRTEKDGVVGYETVEPDNAKVTKTGRSWTAKELRLKSFKDLHTLWYVLLRERNLLASQAEEARRLKIRPEQISSNVKAARCRKSMARIKYVINERRLVYEHAVEELQVQREAALAKAQKEQELAAASQKAEARRAERAARKAEQLDEGEKAAKAAVEGLFQSAPQVEQQKA